MDRQRSSWEQHEGGEGRPEAKGPHALEAELIPPPDEEHPRKQGDDAGHGRREERPEGKQQRHHADREAVIDGHMQNGDGGDDPPISEQVEPLRQEKWPQTRQHNGARQSSPGRAR